MLKIPKLLFGPSSIPYSSPKQETCEGIKQVKRLGLGNMELGWVQGVKLSEEKAKLIKKMGEDENIILTAHGSYFINLNAQEESKLEASKNRLIANARDMHKCGGYGVAFHPAFYMKQDSKKVFENVKNAMKEVIQEVKDNKYDVWIRPEVTGKISQFGTIFELVDLCAELDQSLPVIDWAHQHSRTHQYNTYEEFRKMLEYYEKVLGKEAIKNMHCHIEGIEYNQTGERNHLNLNDSDMNWKDILRAMKEFGCSGVIVSESPNQEDDAMLMKKFYENL